MTWAARAMGGRERANATQEKLYVTSRWQISAHAWSEHKKLHKHESKTSLRIASSKERQRLRRENTVPSIRDLGPSSLERRVQVARRDFKDREIHSRARLPSVRCPCIVRAFACASSDPVYSDSTLMLYCEPNKATIRARLTSYITSPCTPSHLILTCVARIPFMCGSTGQ
jgi:hypothetical protein